MDGWEQCSCLQQTALFQYMSFHLCVFLASEEHIRRQQRVELHTVQWLLHSSSVIGTIGSQWPQIRSLPHLLQFTFFLLKFPALNDLLFTFALALLGPVLSKAFWEPSCSPCRLLHTAHLRCMYVIYHQYIAVLMWSCHPSVFLPCFVCLAQGVPQLGGVALLEEVCSWGWALRPSSQIPGSQSSSCLLNKMYKMQISPLLQLHACLDSALLPAAMIMD